MATLTNFDVPVFAQQALQGFVSTLVPISAFSTKYTSDGLAMSDIELVPVIGNATATTFGGSYAVSGGTASVITVNVNKQKIVPVSMRDIELAASGGQVNANSWAFQQGAALATAVLQDIWSLLTTANFGLVTAVSVGSLGVAELRAGRLALSKNKVPTQPRSFVLDSDPYDTLLGISNFIQVQLAGDNEALREGRVSRALGADIYETNALPGTNSIMGFIAHPAAVGVAMRYLAPQAGNTYFRAEPVVDEKTGIVMGIRDFYDNAAGTRYVVLEANYGYAAGLTQGARLYKRND